MPIYKTKEKRDGLSKYRVRINYIDDSGKNRSLTRIAYGLAAAKELEAKLNRNKNEQVHSNMMLQDLIELYFEFKQIDVRESTLKKAKGITYKYIYPLDIRLNKLSVRRLNEWKLSIGNLPLSHTMKKNIYGQFRSILNWAVSKEYLKSNPLIQVPEPLKIVLDQHYKQCRKYSGFNHNFFIAGGYRPLRDTSIENVNKEAAKRAGLHHIRIHDFRHSHASLLANNNINILEISRRLGHKNIEQTLNRYSHFYPAEQEKAVKVLDKIKI